MFNKLLTGTVLAFSLLLIFSFNVGAQSTWSDIHAILQTNCFGTSCHDPGAPNGLVLIDTDQNAVYNNLVNVTPGNPDAQASGYKLVDPGYPHHSFLLRKINQGLDPDNDLSGIAQGKVMPKGLGVAPLSDEEIDLINAWILDGAPQNGTVVGAASIADYYANGGLPHQTPIAAPDPEEGFQIHFGSIFMPPNSEKEFFLKRKLPNITEEMEITRLETYIDIESHHFILYKYNNQAKADAQPNGLREVTNFSDAIVDGTTMVAAWQNESDILLPPGTAYMWEVNPTLDLNLHLRNYSATDVLKAEVYTNVYLAPRKPETTEMISDLSLFSMVPTGGFDCDFLPGQFCIPADGIDKTFSGSVTSSVLDGANSGDSLYVWLVSTHTHKYGVAYDVFLRNPGGSKGEQIYDGDYNFDYSFNQGFYDFEDPAVRYFDIDTMVIKASDGFLHEATFNNTGTNDVGFGLTTNDEMMLMFLQYTTQRRTIPGIEKHDKKSKLTVYPNPASGNAPIYFARKNTGDEVYITVYDVIGKEVMVQKFPTGSKQLFLDNSRLSSGIFLYKAWSDKGTLDSGKLVIY
ncbi:MAG: T9SS type A sorting domain-containing protein [Flavobacteriales bacterium]|nr:T9SS type A sorting domain-containing protein [Flavobacteriales bacterium]